MFDGDIDVEQCTRDGIKAGREGDLIEFEFARLGSAPCGRHRNDRIRSHIDENDVLAVERLEISHVEAEPLGSDRMIVGQQESCHLRVANDSAYLVANKLGCSLV